MKCLWCEKEIVDVNFMVKEMHINCARRVAEAYCLVTDQKISQRS